MGRVSRASGVAAVAAVIGLSVWASSPYSSVLTAPLAHVPGGDTTGHVLIMGALAAACVLAFSPRRWRGRRFGAARVMGLVALGVTVDEVVQAVVPSRTFSWSDLAASLVGVALFGTLAAVWLARRQRPEIRDRP
ncbi:MAG: VanZ family protein [Bacteroidota bacterium]